MTRETVKLVICSWCKATVPADENGQPELHRCDLNYPHDAEGHRG